MTTAAKITPARQVADTFQYKVKNVQKLFRLYCQILPGLFMTFKMKAMHGFYPHKDTFRQATAAYLMDKLRKIIVSLYHIFNIPAVHTPHLHSALRLQI